MTPDTPYRWLSRVARVDPDRVCLVDDAQTMSYRDVLGRVDARAAEMRSRLTEWQIIPVEVSLDVESVIEILATGHAGGVPFPCTELSTELPTSTAPGVAVCVRTSGSSGPPKVVPLSYTNISASVAASRSRLNNGQEDLWLICLPLDHVGGLSIVWRTLEAGGSALIAPFDTAGEAVDRHRPTIASMVPTMVGRLVDTNPAALASIGIVLVGGASLGDELWQRCLDAGVQLVATYGSTEAGSQIATARPTDVPVRAAAPLNGFDVVIVGRDGEPASEGETGIISVDGPAVFDGYLGELPRLGPFHTSDLGRFDAEGRLHVEGRVDDVIVSGGENVSLGRVAAAINRLDEVRDVCVVAMADEDWGEIGCAMVVTEAGLDAVSAKVRHDLKPHERPKRWLRRDSIPEMANGKHDLAAVRQAFEEDSWT
jgi:O-succinylbenzoic acid--CoA ligase